MKWKIYSAGTTSSRSGDMINKMIDLLNLLDKFWKKGNFQKWNTESQTQFARLMVENNFMKSKVLENNIMAPKTSRQKTSYLEQFGFVDAKRNITNLGKLLLSEANKNQFFPIINNYQSAFLIGLLNIEYNGFFCF